MIVLDTCSLSALLEINSLDILLATFRLEVFAIPKAVWDEIQAGRLSSTASNALRIHRDRLVVRNATDEEEHYAIQLREILDSGESEAITMAKMHNLRLITDDLTARKAAKRLGVKISGTVFVLKYAYIRCPVETREQLRALLDRLRAVLFFGHDLREWALEGKKGNLPRHV